MISKILWKLVGYIAAGIAAILLFLFAYNLLTASDKVKGRLGENQTDAAVESGSDAMETTGDQAAKEDETDKGVKGTNDAIDEADDAAGVADAAFDGLCDNFGFLCEE